MESIDDFRSRLNGDTLEMIDRLREIVATSHPLLVERIKWSAPSFAIGDEDRITLGIERKGGVRLVLHRGSKPKDARNFRFEDVDGLAKWPACDRGVIVWSDVAAIDRMKGELSRLCRRWIDQVD